MNAVDVGIVVVLAFLTWMGSVQHLTRQVSISIGAIGGLLLGVLIYGKLAFLASNSIGRSIILSIIVLAASLMCYDVLLTISGRVTSAVRHGHRATKLTLWQRVSSACTALLTGILLLWVGFGVFGAAMPDGLRQQLRASTLVAFTQDRASLPTFFRKAANLLTPFAPPQAFAREEPLFSDNTAVNRNFSALDKAIGKTADSVFKVQSWGCNATTSGSGFMVTKHAIVTNAHVVAGATRIVVQSRNNETYIADTVLFDPANDIAVLKVASTLPAEPLALQQEDSTGGIASVLGYPNGGVFGDSDAIILERLSAKGYDIYNKSLVTRSIYVLRANVVAGDSGSALIDTSGKVVGLIFGHSTLQSHTGYALTAAQIVPSIERAVRQGASVSSGACAN